MKENKPVHELSGLEYTEKNDFGQFPILVIGQRRHVPAIRVFADKQGELFVMLYGVAGSCGFSSWTNKHFTGAIRRLGVEIYRNANIGAFAVKVSDVATIAEELLTLPRAESLVMVDDAFVSKTNKFLEWWNNKALAAIEKKAHRKLIPEPPKPAEVAAAPKEGTAESNDANDKDAVFLGVPYSEIATIVFEIEYLRNKIKKLIEAGLSRDIAIRLAMNLRKNFYKDNNDTSALGRSNYEPIEKIAKVFNPRAVARKLDLDWEESCNE